MDGPSEKTLLSLSATQHAMCTKKWRHLTTTTTTRIDFVVAFQVVICSSSQGLNDKSPDFHKKQKHEEFWR